MLTNFWQGLGDKLAEKWLAAIVVPSTVFLLGGLLAWITHFGSNGLEMWFVNLTPILQGTLLIGMLLIGALAGSLIQRLVPPILHLIEGYWPHWLAGPFTNHQRRIFTSLQDRWEALRIKEYRQHDSLGTRERYEYALLDQRLKHFPAQADQLLPTSLGNMLRAAEQRPTEKYGLDVLVCWPRLWLILPEDVRTELVEARSNLNTAVGFWTWSIVFLVWTILAWWAFPLGCITAFIVYRWIMSAAQAYGNLLEAAFDIHRFSLYQALHWPPPAQTDEEPEAGKMLSSYLFRGESSLSKPVRLKYTDSAEDTPSSSASMKETDLSSALPGTKAAYLLTDSIQAEKKPPTTLDDRLLALTSPADHPQRPEIIAGGVAKGQSERGGSGNDGLLENARWLKLVTECITLEGDLTDLRTHLDQKSQRLLDHTILRIQELLVRSDVEMIMHEQTFDLMRHKPEPMNPAPLPGTTVIATLHPGFAVGRRVLRRAQVQVSQTPRSDQQNTQTGE